MRRCTRCGMWLDERRGGYCRREVREARAALREWVEETDDSSIRN